MLALEGIRPGAVVGGLGDTERLCADADAAAVERRHRNREALALLMQEPVSPHPRILDDDVGGHGRVEAELLLDPRRAHVLRVEDERGDAFGAGGVGVGSGEEEERARVMAVRDPLLRARDPPAVSVRSRRGPQRAGVGARLGLGQREGAEHLAARERRHESRALLVGPEAEDRERHRARVDGDGDSHPGIGAGQLLENEDVRQEVGAGAAVLLRDAGSHQAELGELAEELLRKAVLAIPFGRVGLDLCRGELTRERLDLPLVAGQLEVHYV